MNDTKIMANSRRSIIGLGAAAALSAPALLLSRNVHADTHASVDAAKAPVNGDVAMASGGDGGEFRRFSMGGADIIIINDGGRNVPGPGSIFGTDQEEATVSALLDENLLPTDQMRISFHPVVIRKGADIILFDTGNAGGTDAPVGNTVENLKRAGIAPDDITKVVLTHFHPDHIGGMTAEDGTPNFPNASYYAGEEEYAFWTSDAAMAGPGQGVAQLTQQKVVPFKDRMTMLKDGDEVVSGVSAKGAFGHTPGHLIFMVEDGGRMLALTADTANHFVLSLQRPEWEVKFDMDKEKAAQTRKDVFGMLAADRIPFIGYHMPFPSLGYVKTEGEGFRFIAESYQFAMEG
ncbi:MBL fold metallo-hydrolase [Notoacmeibacter marinus]|uniref:MBL fold metallo-hydrolase n=1 Tax=Notoacmeibacter marinus TaxID=1876515 RepID=UPI0013B0629D|nr:MBL fold metallo-hydrolase [Notoacmeibacter marinus]